MTEDEAISWITSRYPDKVEVLSRFVELVKAEANRQNLIARSTLETMWSRHIVDSAQLISHAPDNVRRWLDIGTGAGFPGMVVAIVRDVEMVMVEPRRLRIEFLRECVAQLGVRNAHVEHARVETLSYTPTVDVISARAVMSLDALLEGTAPLRSSATRYVLPKGVSASADVYDIEKRWFGTFHVEHSIVDPASGIVLAEGVSKR